MIEGANIRPSVFNCFPRDQESNCEAEKMNGGRETNVVYGMAY